MSAHPLHLSWHEAAAGDVTLRYQVLGEGSPLVLLPGLAGSPDWWSRNLKWLAQSHRVYALDLFRFGGSRPRPRFTLAEAPQRLAAWMDTLKLEHATIIGHSMGGHVAAELAVDFPGKVARLVLVAPSVLYAKDAWKLSPAGVLRTIPQIPLPLWPVLFRDAVTAGPLTVLRTIRDLLTHDLRATLPTIQAPTLVLWGGRDELLPVRLAAEISALIPQCELRILPNAAHILMFEEPAWFHAAVADFLRCSGQG